jgi:NADH-quinone oxidoreductase subunit L
MVDELAGADWTGLRMIPAPPLLVALFLGLQLAFSRRPLSRGGAAILAVLAMVASFLASVLSFADLLSNEETSALVDRMASWVGAGVGGSALIGDLAFRFDALSSVMSLVVSGVGLLLVLYAARSPGLGDSGTSDRQRFFCFASFQLGMSLVFVLADNLFLMLIGFAGVGMGAYLFAGFHYGDLLESEAANRVFVMGRIGDAGLLIATLLLFRALGEAGTPSLGVEDVRAALLDLGGLAFGLPGWTGFGEVAFVEAVGVCLLLAALGLGAQLLFFAAPVRKSPGLFVGSALMQTVTGMMASGYLIVRFSFVFSAAPFAAETMAVLGAALALAAATIACRSHQVSRVLAWSSLSQLGLVLVAAGLGSQSTAVFELISHAFFKGLLLMAAGVIILALKGEEDMRFMGNLGSRLTLTRIALWIGLFSLAGGLPLTAGFYCTQQIVVAARGADPGFAYGLIYPVVLITVALTTFYVCRLIYLTLYGDTRLPPHLHWDEVEDPEPTLLWLMGILSILSILGAVIGFPQFWADFLFAGEIENSNSLQYFLSGVVSNDEGPALEIGQLWAAGGWAFLMTLLGGGAAILFYSMRPDPLMAFVAFSGHQSSRAFSWVQRLFKGAGEKGRGRFEGARAALQSTLATSSDLESEDQSLSAGLLRYLADRLLKRAQSGFVQHSLALSLVGSLALLVYFLWAGGV